MELWWWYEWAERLWRVLLQAARRWSWFVCYSFSYFLRLRLVLLLLVLPPTTTTVS